MFDRFIMPRVPARPGNGSAVMKWQFWRWLFLGLQDRPGYRQLVNWWLVVHIAVGIAVAQLVGVSVHEAAQTFLLPLAGIFIGLSFAWVGNAQALLQESEIEKIAEYHPDGIRTYVYKLSNWRFSLFS